MLTETYTIIGQITLSTVSVVGLFLLLVAVAEALTTEADVRPLIMRLAGAASATAVYLLLAG